jgi:polynucleotide 5'-hydroxyl-kinase GRC3/NOL9
MSSSKKRGKASSEGASSQKKRREISNDDDPSSPFAWTPSGVQVLLPSSQRLVFIGKAILTVHSGEIDIAGSVLTARSLPAEIYTDETAPLIISVIATEGRIPLALSATAGFSLTGSNINSGENRGFELHVESEYEVSAHILQIPVVWKQAAAGIAESIAAGQEVGAPPPVIAICGTKKVGKSTFARYLSNVLLNTHSSVAYLDTGETRPYILYIEREGII